MFSIYQVFHATSFAGNMPAIIINLPNAITSVASKAFTAMGHPSQTQNAAIQTS